MQERLRAWLERDLVLVLSVGVKPPGGVDAFEIKNSRIVYLPGIAEAERPLGAIIGEGGAH